MKVSFPLDPLASLVVFWFCEWKTMRYNLQQEVRKAFCNVIGVQRVWKWAVHAFVVHLFRCLPELHMWQKLPSWARVFVVRLYIVKTLQESLKPTRCKLNHATWLTLQAYKNMALKSQWFASIVIETPEIPELDTRNFIISDTHLMLNIECPYKVAISCALPHVSTFTYLHAYFWFYFSYQVMSGHLFRQ